MGIAIVILGVCVIFGVLFNVMWYIDLSSYKEALDHYKELIGNKAEESKMTEGAVSSMVDSYKKQLEAMDLANRVDKKKMWS